MDDITGMVRSGRLADATAAIQRRLGGGSPGAPPHPMPPGAPPHPMRDVTPSAPALTAPGGSSRAKARPAPVRPREARSPDDRTDGAPAGRIERLAGPLAPLLYRPSAPADEAPLVVMLHGCTQTPEDFARGTRMNAVAEAHGAYVLWPGQSRSANANGCWNWFETAHQGRGGEAGALAALVREVLPRTGADPRRVHIAGLSAGGAMAAVVAAARPDLIASVGIHSGLGAGAAGDMPSAFAAMGGRGAAPAPLRVPAIVIHGGADRTVAPSNAAAIAAAGRDRGAPRPRRRAATEGGRAFARTLVPAGPGAAAVELIEIEGLGHAWSGGSATGSYADPAGPDASALMMRFFLANPLAG